MLLYELNLLTKWNDNANVLKKLPHLNKAFFRNSENRNKKI